MPSNEMPKFPRGAIAMGNGNLLDVTSVKVTQKANVKLQHTLQTTAAGVVIGHEETEVSFDAVVGETGPERDYLRDLRAGKVRTLRIKIPGETFAVVGVASQRSLDLPMDDAIKYSITFVGKTVI